MKFKLILSAPHGYEVQVDDVPIFYWSEDDLESLDDYICSYDNPIIQILDNGKEKVICE